MSQHVVIVGSGAAGAALAYRLTCSPDVGVTLLEAGPDERPAEVQTPAMWPMTLGGELDYGYASVVQSAMGQRVVPFPRGRVLGGSTCLNAMIHMRPADSDLATWGPGWAADDLRPSFVAMETHRGGGDGRGVSGPVPNRTARVPNSACSAFVEAAVGLGYPRLDDLNSRARGVGWYDLSIDDQNNRADAAQTYLRPYLDRPNLTIRTGCTVERIEFADGLVTALHVRQDGKEQTLSISGEVVLAAGAIDSPALLMRSGVGPAAHLSEAGVATLIDLPGVGQNLHDHPALPVVWSSEAELAAPENQWFESALGLQQEPRLAGRSVVMSFGHIPYLPPDTVPPVHGATALVGLLDPKSRGTLRLDPDNPLGAPLIDPRMLCDHSDVDTLIEGVRIAQELVRRPELASFGFTELLPGDAFGSDLENFVRLACGSYAHPVGTCAMGKGNNAVVDFDLRVRGTANLRIADASIMPTIPTAAPSVTIQAIGWHAADLIMGASLAGVAGENSPDRRQ